MNELKEGNEYLEGVLDVCKHTRDGGCIDWIQVDRIDDFTYFHKDFFVFYGRSSGYLFYTYSLPTITNCSDISLSIYSTIQLNTLYFDN